MVNGAATEENNNFPQPDAAHVCLMELLYSCLPSSKHESIKAKLEMKEEEEEGWMPTL